MRTWNGSGVNVRSKPAPASRAEALLRLWQPPWGYAAAQLLKMACCMTDEAQQPTSRRMPATGRC